MRIIMTALIILATAPASAQSMTMDELMERVWRNKHQEGEVSRLRDFYRKACENRFRSNDRSLANPLTLYQDRGAIERTIARYGLCGYFYGKYFGDRDWGPKLKEYYYRLAEDRAYYFHPTGTLKFEPFPDVAQKLIDRFGVQYIYDRCGQGNARHRR